MTFLISIYLSIYLSICVFVHVCVFVVITTTNQGSIKHDFTDLEIIIIFDIFTVSYWNDLETS